MRFALVLIGLLMCCTGCTTNPLASFLRAPEDGKTGATDSSATELNQPAATGAATPPGSTPGAETLGATSPPGDRVSVMLDNLERDGKLSREERREFEVTLSELEDPNVRNAFIAMIAAAASKQPAQRNSALDEGRPGQYPPDAASGYGSANSVMNAGGRDRPRLANPDPTGKDQGYAPEPDRSSYSHEIADRLRDDLRSRDRYPEDQYNNSGTYDPRSDRVSQVGYAEPRTRDRDDSYDRGANGRDRTGRNERSRAGARQYQDGYAWEQSLDETIALLEQQTVDVPRGDDEVTEHAYLRMLYLMSGRKEDALRPIQGIPAVSQDFWIEEMYGLADFLDHEEFPTASKRAAAALERFEKASKRLGEMASLRVKRAAFCREVKSYGVITRFPKDSFQPLETVLLYAEIENFRSTPGPEGYRTELRGSYIIQNEAKMRVGDGEVLAPIVDVCENERRDFFLNYFVTLPQQIYPGRYKLILTIEDTQAQSFGTTTIDFEVTAPSAK